MPEPHNGEPDSPLWQRPAFVVPLVIFLLAALAGAVAVVVNNAMRVNPGTAPVVLGPVVKDTLFKKKLQAYRQGITRYDKRLREGRERAGTLTERQARLARFCDSALALFKVQVTTLDTIGTAARRKEYKDEVNLTYVSLRETLQAFSAAVESTAGPGVDSLDREFEKLLDER